MKFSASINDLRNTLTLVANALPTRTPSEILEHVIIEAADDVVRFTASDGQLAMKATLPMCRVSEEGRCAIRGKLLSDIVRKMPDGEAVLQTNKNSSYLRVGSIKTVLSTLDANGYPMPNEENVTKSVTLPQSIVLDAITKTECCIASSDESRIELRGGYFEVLPNGKMHMIGLDGFRMAVYSADLSAYGEKIEAIIPLRFLTILKKILKSSDSDMIKLSFAENRIYAYADNIEMQCSLIAGKYVNWGKFFDTSFHTTATINTRKFSDATERADLIARSDRSDRDNSHLLKLNFTDSVLSVMADTNINSISETLDVDKEGEDTEIFFNIRYVIDAIKVINCEELTISIESKIAPVFITPADNDGLTLMIAPVNRS